MVGLGASQQTPPAIETTLISQDNLWSLGTTGGISNGHKGELRQRNDIECSTLAMRGRTGIDRENPTVQLGVKSEDRSHASETKSTPAFSDFLFRRKIAELISLLNELKRNLTSPDGARIMTSFRSSLEQIWHVAGALPREKLIIVSAVEEAVRNRKWRELTIGQVDVLIRVLSNVNSGAEISSKELDRAFLAIHRSQIDIYPSAGEDFDDDESEVS